jgi:hypothetical protein
MIESTCGKCYGEADGVPVDECKPCVVITNEAIEKSWYTAVLGHDRGSFVEIQREVVSLRSTNVDTKSLVNIYVLYHHLGTAAEKSGWN